MSDEMNEIEGMEEETVEEAVDETAAEEKEPARPKVVTLEGHAGDDVEVFGEEFSVTLHSVTGREYVFDDQSKCLSWITRRNYNGESVSPEVNQLRDVLSQGRAYRRALTAADNLHSVLTSTEPTSDTAVRRINRSADQLQENLASLTNAAFDNVAGVYDRIVGRIKSALEIQPTVTGEGEEATADYSEITEQLNSIEAELAAALHTVGVTFGNVTSVEYVAEAEAEA